MDKANLIKFILEKRLELINLGGKYSFSHLKIEKDENLKYKNFDVLEEELTKIEKLIQNIKDQNNQEEFKNSDEGKNIIEKFTEKRRKIVSLFEKDDQELDAFVKQIVNKICGDNWGFRYNQSHFELFMKEKDSEKGIFGATIEFYKKMNFECVKNKENKWDMSIGSTGSFELNSDRANYYIKVGEILSKDNITLLQSIFDRISKYTEKHEEIYKSKLEFINKVIKNPILVKNETN